MHAISHLYPKPLSLHFSRIVSIASSDRPFLKFTNQVILQDSYPTGVPGRYDYLSLVD